MKKHLTILMSVVCALMCAVSYSAETNARLSRDIVRLHIIANSDLPEDQALKLKVRDAVLSATSASASKEDVSSLVERYEAIARDELLKNGCDCPVHAEYGKYYFPTKEYGALTYPAGEYDAVRIVIGEGKGQNWWCVLFPPLCYVKGSVNSEDAAKSLKEMLSPEDYRLITSGKNASPGVKIKFKLVEIINSVRSRRVKQ